MPYFIKRIAIFARFFKRNNSEALQLSRTTYESTLHNPPPYWFKYLHDTCMVRPSQTAGNEDINIMATHWRHTLLVGNSTLRILPNGTCKPPRFRRKRRSVLTHATARDTGSSFSYRLHSRCKRPFPRPAAPVESRSCRAMPNCCCVFCI